MAQLVPSSLLLFLLVSSSLWVASDGQGGDHCPPQPCGNVTVSFPFGLIPDGAAQTDCGDVGIGSKVRCYNNRSLYLEYSQSDISMQILSIFYDNRSLHILPHRYWRPYFNSSSQESCRIPTADTIPILAPPLSFSPDNQKLIFYNCTKPPPQGAGLVETVCHDNTFVRAADDGRPDEQPGSYFLEGCNFTMVPVLGVSGKKVNASDYEQLVEDGFLATWQWPPQLPLPPPGARSRKNMVIGIVCGVGGGILLVACFFFVWHKRKRRKQARASNGFMRSESSMQSYSKDLELGGSPHIFTYEELEEATDGFSDSRELGDGGFGTVYRGKLRDGRVVAVKRLYKNNYKRVEQFINEVDILSRLHHQNLVILYGCTSRSSRDLMLVYEFIPNGTVADHLHGSRASERGLTWTLRMNIAIETAEALAYLHAVEIIHRDVKTNNILLDNSFHVKVADFGLSRLCPPEVTHVSTVPQGTPGYVDPVYHQCYKLTEKSDVYSFGVVLVELISSKPAVDMTRSHSDINLANMALNRIQNHEVDQLVDPELGYKTDDETKKSIDLVAELAFQCLQLERDSRPSMKEVVETLNCIKNGDSPETKMDKTSSSPKEDVHLLTNNIQFSPDSVIHRFHSQSTTHSVASNASG
ncbi:hypothetical protein BDA96_03G085000 [Sorghum bicolor]|uniref:non-specific serine/threonine protein kinase n=1 Tax=Sorghum bicolor TaxID=4558 RepID=A0A921R9Z6_SORBI|nr:hypothetical protein BDA96_03G085000 [Sorghum bicolor]